MLFGHFCGPEDSALMIVISFVQNKGADQKGIVLEKGLFRTNMNFNVAAFAVCAMLAPIYIVFWCHYKVIQRNDARRFQNSITIALPHIGGYESFGVFKSVDDTCDHRLQRRPRSQFQRRQDI